MKLRLAGLHVCILVRVTMLSFNHIYVRNYQRKLKIVYFALSRTWNCKLMNYDNLCVYIGPLFIVVQASTWGARSLHIGPILVAEGWQKRWTSQAVHYDLGANWGQKWADEKLRKADLFRWWWGSANPRKEWCKHVRIIGSSVICTRHIAYAYIIHFGKLWHDIGHCYIATDFGHILLSQEIVFPRSKKV